MDHWIFDIKYKFIEFNVKDNTKQRYFEILTHLMSSR